MTVDAHYNSAYASIPANHNRTAAMYRGASRLQRKVIG
jgi:hypothetical protein